MDPMEKHYVSAQEALDLCASLGGLGPLCIARKTTIIKTDSGSRGCRKGTVTAERLAARGQALGDVLAPSTSVDCTNLKDELNKLWETLKQLQTELNTHQKEETVKRDEATSAVFIAKEKALKGRIQAYKDCAAIALPKETRVQEEITTGELRRSIKELGDTLSFVRHQRKETMSQLERERHMLVHRQQINDALKDRLENPQEERPGHILLQDLEEKQEKTRTYYRKLMRQMAGFIQQEFPPPTQEDLTKWGRKRKLSGNTGAKEILPLQNILEDLMNKCVETPNDAYVRLDHHYWAPYVELLVRCGIAQRQPGDDQLVRLTPFHL